MYQSASGFLEAVERGFKERAMLPSTGGGGMKVTNPAGAGNEDCRVKAVLPGPRCGRTRVWGTKWGHV